MSTQNPRGVIAQDLLDTVVPVIEANAASIWACGVTPVHSVPGFQWKAGGYASVVNVNIRCDSAADWETQLGYSSDWGKYAVCQLYDYAFVENNASPLVVCNVWDPFANSTLKTMAAATPNTDLQILIADEVCYCSLSLKGATKTYVLGTDYSYTYNDTTLVGGVLQIFSGSPAALETSFTLEYYIPNLTTITVDSIIGGTDVNGGALGIENIQHCYTDTGVVPATMVCPGFGTDPELFSAANAQVQSISNNQFRAVYICDIDTTTTTNWTKIFAWKNSMNFVSAFAIAVWPEMLLGAKQYVGSVVYAVAQNVTTAQFGNIPYAVPSNKHNVGITGLVLADGTPIRMDLGTANSIENFGVVTAVNDTGWTLIGDYTTDYPLSTQIPQMWTNERYMFNFLGNTLSLTLKQFIDEPGNQRYLALIGETTQQYGNHLIAVQAANTLRVMFDPSKNLITDIEAGKYTYTILWTPPTPIRTLIMQQSYDANGLAAWIAQITIPSIS